MSHDPGQTYNPLPQLEPYDDPEPGSIWFISLSGTIILIALVVAISALNFTTETDESVVKFADKDADALLLVPSAPITAAASREKLATLTGMLDRGEVSRAAYMKYTQQILLQSWMNYETIDSKDQKHTLTRIPVTEAMKLIAAEYSAKAGPKKVAVNEGPAHEGTKTP